MSNIETLEIPDGALQWSSESLHDLDPSIKHTIRPHDMIHIPDLGLPAGKYYIKVTGFIIPWVEKDKSSNG